MARLTKKQVFEELPNEPAPDLSHATSFLPSKFRVPRKDTKGISAHVNFYTAPFYVRAAEELRLRIKDFGTLSDVYACALHYGLEWIQKQQEIGYTSVWSQLKMWSNICDEAEMEESIMLAMERVREAVNRKVGHGALQEAKRLVAMVRHETEMMPDGYYKERALAFLETEFNGLYRKGPAG